MKQFIAVDIGGTAIKYGIVSEEGKILQSLECPTPSTASGEELLELLYGIIVPLIGEHSERKVYKTDRARRILLSAAKQSLKGAVPQIEEPVSVKDFIKSSLPTDSPSLQACPAISSPAEIPPLRLMAYCFEEEDDRRVSLGELLSAYPGKDVVVMIGPEGDFSPEEARAALDAGFQPVHFGPSRMRTETAALFAVSAVYSHFVL